ncbi:MAG: hypothetical protein ACKO91_10380 [Acidimicrobiales bacterium]
MSTTPADMLAAAVEVALPGWVVRAVESRARAWTGTVEAGWLDDARSAGERAREEVGARLRSLLAHDVDEQRTNPLGVIRTAVRYPTEVLQRAGVPPVVRDEFLERTFADDVYGLAPATWRDLGEEVHEAGIIWGAWKASTVLGRRRAEGRLR